MSTKWFDGFCMGLFIIFYAACLQVTTEQSHFGQQLYPLNRIILIRKWFNHPDNMFSIHQSFFFVNYILGAVHKKASIPQ